ncbi:MAG TPA: PaaI family thioesterase [Microscillaceae bacterium]|nr:PaaI family thioesterase [Microscillaceae bacterium]
MDTTQKQETPFFQQSMEGNVCFGCGHDNHEGLKIKSHWEGEESVCVWQSQEKYNGWKGIMNGGIMATIIDCHTMATATMQAYKEEGNRAWDSQPEYRYATGTMNIKYLKPTPNDIPVKLVAKVTEVKGRKTTMTCELWSNDTKTAEAEVVAIRVYDSSQQKENNPFKG